MRAVVEKGEADDLGLLARQAVERRPHPPRPLRRGDQRIGAGRGLGGVGGVGLGQRQAGMSRRVDAQVAGDGENPGGGAGARRVVERRLAPHRQQRFLGQLLGRVGAAAEADQMRLEARREMGEQRGKGGAVAALGDGADQRPVLVARRLAHRPAERAGREGAAAGSGLDGAERMHAFDTGAGRDWITGGAARPRPGAAYSAAARSGATNCER
jgi:hypothetical protein